MSIETSYGAFKSDASGLMHWRYLGERGTTKMELAMLDALQHMPHGLASWFWWQGQFVPIAPADTLDALKSRWQMWNDPRLCGSATEQLRQFAQVPR